jgi:hypothetical protein
VRGVGQVHGITGRPVYPIPPMEAKRGP